MCWLKPRVTFLNIIIGYASKYCNIAGLICLGKYSAGGNEGDFAPMAAFIFSFVEFCIRHWPLESNWSRFWRITCWWHHSWNLSGNLAWSNYPQRTGSTKGQKSRNCSGNPFTGGLCPFLSLPNLFWKIFDCLFIAHLGFYPFPVTFVLGWVANSLKHWKEEIT